MEGSTVTERLGLSLIAPNHSGVLTHWSLSPPPDAQHSPQAGTKSPLFTNTVTQFTKEAVLPLY